MIPRSALLLGLVAAVVFGQEAPINPDITADELLGHIKLLSSDGWGGRGTGSAGEKKATEYIARHFKRLGLEPAGENGSWFQPVKVPAGVELLACSMELLSKKPAKLVLDKDFRPFSASASGRVEGDAVFVGYGVTAPKLGYDDYAGIEVSGKVVFLFRNLPHNKPEWRRGGRRHAPFLAKLAQAVGRGAIGVVVVNDPWNFPTAEEVQQRKLPKARPDQLQRGGIGRVQGPVVPFVHLTRAAAERIFPALFGATPNALEQAIESTGAPASRPGRLRVRLALKLKPKFDIGRNVCGLLRAKGEAALDEVIVVGGHHDHLGRGGKGGSLERDPRLRRTIHNGADDNASGTSGVLEAAAYMAARRAHLRRSVLFLTFTGEERGLLGSRYFVDHPTIPLEQVVAMINMDMIGRLQDGDGRLFIGGVGTSPVWPPLLKRVNETIALPLIEGPGGRAPSDNTSFYAKKKPVLFFFTGMHPQYHRPSDDWQKIDSKGMEQVVRLAAGVVDELARRSAPVVFTQADSGGAGPPRPIIGISVGGSEGGGVKVAAVVPNGPAQKAGMLAGDVIVEIAGRKVTDFRSLRGAMRPLKIAQKVKVEILRGGKRMVFEVTLGRS